MECRCGETPSTQEILCISCRTFVCNECADEGVETEEGFLCPLCAALYVIPEEDDG